MKNDRFGFSTGALEKGNYFAAIEWMRTSRVQSVELSALRYEELEPLVNDLDKIKLQEFRYISFHAPSSFERSKEEHVIALLDRVLQRGWNVVVHPDVIYVPSRWRHFGERLLIENMDRRKGTGRTVDELDDWLRNKLPKARLCLDMAHARQLDTTLGLLWNIATIFKDRIAEIHISELDSRCRHLPLSESAIVDYRRFKQVLKGLPVIIESVMDRAHIALRSQELQLARAAIGSDDHSEC